MWYFDRRNAIILCRIDITARISLTIERKEVYDKREVGCNRERRELRNIPRYSHDPLAPVRQVKIQKFQIFTVLENWDQVLFNKESIQPNDNDEVNKYNEQLGPGWIPEVARLAHGLDEVPGHLAEPDNHEEVDQQEEGAESVVNQIDRVRVMALTLQYKVEGDEKCHYENIDHKVHALDEGGSAQRILLPQVRALGVEEDRRLLNVEEELVHHEQEYEDGQAIIFAYDQ